MATSRKRHHRKMPAFEKFDPFETLIDGIARQNRLGPKGRTVIRETLELVAEHRGGVGGFLERLRTAGLEAKVASWDGAAEPIPVSGEELEQALGADVINKIAGKAGVSRGFARTVASNALPELIGLLPQGGFPGLTALSSASLGGEAAQAPPQPVPLQMAAQRSGAFPLARVLVPGAAALVIALGAGIFFVGHGRTGHRAPAPSGSAIAKALPAVREEPHAPPAQIQPSIAAARNGPSVLPHAPSIPARLMLSNDNGRIIYSGVIRDEATSAAIISSLKAVFGADQITGRLRVDPHAGAADWSDHLRVALGEFKVPGSQVLFDGDTVRAGGAVPVGERDRIISALKEILGPKFALSMLPPSQAPSVPTAAAPAAPAAAQVAAQPAAPAPSPPNGIDSKTPIHAEDQAVLQLPTIYFASNSSKLSRTGKAALEEVAGMMKTLPSQAAVSISSYASKADNPRADFKLSQRRAKAVRQALVDAGVNPAILKADTSGVSGYRSGREGTGEGRSSATATERPHVEFHIVRQ